MKWNNKGHEFDELGNTFIKNKDLVLIGSNFEDGISFLERHDLREQLLFLGANIETHETAFTKNVTQEAVRKFIQGTSLADGGKTVIVNYPDIALMEKVIAALVSTGIFIKNINVFSADDFFERYLSIFAVYVHNKVYFWHGNIVITTICNLNCKYCLNFQPYNKNQCHRPVEELKKEIDILFNAVDKIGYFQITGGEPLLYPELSEFIEYIATKYKDKLGQLVLATNGVLSPSDILCETLKKYSVLVIIDNYTVAVPRLVPSRKKLIDQIQKYAIKYYDQDVNSKFEILFPPARNYDDISEKELINRASCCHGKGIMFKESKNGNLYFCNYTSFAITAGLIEDDPDNYYDLHNFDIEKNKELVEWRLGYSNKGYDNFCRYCNGHVGINQFWRTAGEQQKGRLNWDIKNPTYLKTSEYLTSRLSIYGIAKSIARSILPARLRISLRKLINSLSQNPKRRSKSAKGSTEKTRETL